MENKIYYIVAFVGILVLYEVTSLITNAWERHESDDDIYEDSRRERLRRLGQQGDTRYSE